MIFSAFRNYILIIYLKLYIFCFFVNFIIYIYILYFEMSRKNIGMQNIFD